jgi:nucleoside-diphosphate-sugar epimerase
MKLPRASAGAGASVGVPTATVYNLSDDEPAQSADVTKYAAELLGIEPPPLEPFEAGNVAPTARRFFQESRRISNGLARRELGWSPLYPSYREGLKAVLAVGGR